MHTFKIVYKNGTVVTDKAEKAIEIIRKYDLYTKENISTKIIQMD